MIDPFTGFRIHLTRASARCPCRVSRSLSILSRLSKLQALLPLQGAAQRARAAVRRGLEAQALTGSLALRLTPALAASHVRALLDALCEARPQEAAWPALDLLMGAPLGAPLTPSGLPPALLTFDDAAPLLERGPLIGLLEARQLTALALLRPEHVDEPEAGVSRHTLRWMLGAGITPGLWVPHASVGVSAAALHQRLRQGASRLRARCGVRALWLATDTDAPDPWLRAAATDLNVPFLFTAKPGLWPATRLSAAPVSAAPVEVCRVTLTPTTSPSALYDLLRASPTSLTRAILWRQLTHTL
jgi:hypothetical protein